MAKKAVKKVKKGLTTKKAAAKPSVDNPNDIMKYIDLAIETEKRGISFYKEAKEKVDDYNMGKLIDTLLEQEFMHLKFFTDIYNTEKRRGTADAAEEAAKYGGQNPMKNPVFDMKHMHDIAKKKTTIYQLFSKAIEFEQEGHDLYMDLANKIKNSQIKKFLKTVANEELRHKEFIQMHQDAIYDTGYWMGLEHTRLQT